MGSTAARELIADDDGEVADEQGARGGHLEDDEVHDESSTVSGGRSVRIARAHRTTHLTFCAADRRRLITAVVESRRQFNLMLRAQQKWRSKQRDLRLLRTPTVHQANRERACRAA